MVDQSQRLQSVEPDVELPAEMPGVMAVFPDKLPVRGKMAHTEIFLKADMNVSGFGKNRFTIPIRIGFDSW